MKQRIIKKIQKQNKIKIEVKSFFYRIHEASFFMTSQRLKAINIPPNTIMTIGSFSMQFLVYPFLQTCFRAWQTSKHGKKNKIMDPKTPPVKSRTYWMQSLRVSPTTQMITRRATVRVMVFLETFIGFTYGKNTFRMLVLMTMMQTENAAMFRNTQNETMQQMNLDSAYWSKSKLQYLYLCEPSSMPKARVPVRGMTKRVNPEIRKAALMKKLVSVVFLTWRAMPGRLWWNISANRLLEKIYAKLSTLKTPSPSGTGVLTPYLIMMQMAPMIMATIEMNLTTMITNCRALVFSIDLKLKAAPDKKNNASHTSYSRMIQMSLNTTDRMLPVMMHLEMAVPVRQTEITKEGMILYFWPYKMPNCQMWSYFFYTNFVLVLKELSSPYASFFSASPSGAASFSLLISERCMSSCCLSSMQLTLDMASTMYMAELQLMTMMSSIHMVERTIPPQKKLWGRISGPTPSNKLTEVNSALYLGSIIIIGVRVQFQLDDRQIREREKIYQLVCYLMLRVIIIKGIYQSSIYRITRHYKQHSLKNYNKKMTERQQPSSLKINSDLVKKIKQTLEANPNIDQSKVIDLLQNDNTLRLKKQVIKAGVVEYFRKFVQKSQPTPQQNNLNPTSKALVPIDLTLQTLKKKVKKSEQSYQFQDKQTYKFQKLGGITQIKKQLNETLFQYVNNRILYKEICSQAKGVNKGYLISGSVGCGKTILANCILSELKRKQYSCFFINSYELVGNDADEKIKKLFQAMEEKAPSVLCIDNIEEICSKQTNKRPQGSSLSTLCLYIDKAMDKDFRFLATSSSPQKLDILTKPGRFYKQIKVSNPTEQQRKQILAKVLSSYSHKLTEEAIKQITKLTSGYVAVDLVSFVQEALNKCVKRIVANIDSQKQIILEDFIQASKDVIPVLKRQGFAKIPTTKLSDIGALQHIKQALINEIILPMRSREKFRKLNFEINGGGVLLYGPPGCGKTMLAKGIANEANVNFITVKGPQLLTKYVGESEEAVRKVFERARSSAPSVIFFDEFDALAPKRQDSGNQVTERVVNTLLNELNGIDDRNMIFVIAATNRPDIIDEAVLRSGRIQLKLQVPMPNQADRQSILQKLTQKVGKQQQINIEDIALRTQKFSGADLAYLVKKSIISAVATNRQGINNKDMIDAIQSFRKDNVFGKKPEIIVEEEEKEQEEFAYHPEEELKPRKLQTDQSESVDNQLQTNVKGSKKQQAEGILSEFISFLVHKSKNGIKK